MLAFHRRVVGPLPMSVDELLSRVRERVTVEEGETQPVERGVFGLYVGGRWYRLVPRRDDAAAGVESLDVSRLHREVLEPIFGFGEAGDPGLEFVSDAVPLEELTRRVDEDGGAAFTLMPPTFDQFVDGGGSARADAGESDVLRPEAAVGPVPAARRRRRDLRGPVRQPVTVVRASIVSDEFGLRRPCRCTGHADAVRRGLASVARTRRHHLGGSEASRGRRDGARSHSLPCPHTWMWNDRWPSSSRLKNSCSSVHGSSAHR